MCLTNPRSHTPARQASNIRYRKTQDSRLPSRRHRSVGPAWTRPRSTLFTRTCVRDWEDLAFACRSQTTRRIHSSITKICRPTARSGTQTFCCKSRQWCYLIKTRSILLDTVGAVSPSQEGLNTDTLASLRLSPTADQSENARQSIRAAALPQRISFQHRGLYNHQSDTWIVSSCHEAPTTFDRRYL